MKLLRVILCVLFFIIGFMPGDNQHEKIIYVQKNITLNDAVMLSSSFSMFPTIVGLVIKILSVRRNGVFILPSRASVFDVWKTLLFNKRYILKVHVRVGSTAKQITEQFNSLPGLIGEMPEINEGELLSTTYQYAYGTQRIKLVSGGRYAMKKITKKLWNKYKNTSYLSLPDAIILASIVVKESETKEYPKIAQVFINRLKKNMRLEADSTITYFMNGKKKIYYKDTYIQSGYNTYRNKGLPPTPIGAISSYALESVLSVAQTTKDLFFVKKNKYEHEFFENYKEHLAFQANRGIVIKNLLVQKHKTIDRKRK